MTVILGYCTQDNVRYSANPPEIPSPMCKFFGITPTQRLICNVFVLIVSEFDKSNHLCFRIDSHDSDFRGLHPR